MFCVGSVGGGYYGRAEKCGGDLYEILGEGVKSVFTFLCNMLVKVSFQRLRR